ncbi:MAG: MFS transporter [Tepidisphaeraceae bacterium]|jgi:ACS family hexuronate transporter-like MFS transporter
MLRWRIALLVSVAIAISYLDRQTLPVAIKAVQHDFPFSNEMNANLNTAFLFSYGLMYLGGGRLLDWLGTRRGYAIVMVFWSLACASHGIAEGVGMLAVSRLLLGLGEGGGFPAATKAVTEWFPVTERATAMGIINAGTAVGSVVAGPLIALVVLPHVHWFGITPWRWVFFLTGSLGLAWTLWWAYEYFPPESHPRLRDGERSVLPRATMAGDSPAAPKVRLGELLRFRQTWGVVLAKFLTDAAWYFYLFWLPKYLYDARGFDYKATGSVVWIPPAASGIGAFVGGWFSSWLLRKGFSVNGSRKIALGLSAALMPFVMLAPYLSVPWMIAVFSLAYFGQQSWSTLVMILPTDLFPKRVVGTVAGLVGLGGAMGGVVLGQLAGYLLDHGFSYKPVLAIAGSMHLIAFAVILLMVRVVRPVKLESEAGEAVVAIA